MELMIAIVVGSLYAAGIYMLLRPSPVKLAIGLGLLTNAVNLLIFVAAGLTPGRAPLVAAGALKPVAPYADPLPQALILTAIVIGLGVQAFALVLIKRAYQSVGSDDLDTMTGTDR